MQSNLYFYYILHKTAGVFGFLTLIDGLGLVGVFLQGWVCACKRFRGGIREVECRMDYCMGCLLFLHLCSFSVWISGVDCAEIIQVTVRFHHSLSSQGICNSCTNFESM